MREASTKLVVVALGGNAILQPGQYGTLEEQVVNVNTAMRHVAELVAKGWQVVLTHGNGPQVGNILLQNALAANDVAPMPMDVCGAESQGLIGYLLEQSLLNHLRRRGLGVPVATLFTQIEVDPADEAFSDPRKPVGPFYTREEAAELARREGHTLKEDAGRGWRRVVPSPQPRTIVPRAAVSELVRAGICLICSGGGGVPVVRSAEGAFAGVAAVIDKDLAAALLASEVAADALLILTDVANVYLDYDTPGRRALRTVTAAEMAAFAAAGHFRAGSMGPKVEACLRFVRRGRFAVITGLEEAVRALEGNAGTRVIP